MKLESIKESCRIAMVCDFFYPRLGGVEMHIWSLAQCLLQRGHKVIVITHGINDRKGVRYMTNGLKVYYLPKESMVDNVAFPTLCGGFELFRNIIIREQIQIIHGHQATSTMMHECLLQGRTMGYKTVYTDHSLFGFADVASVHLNKLMKFTLSDIDHVICVSHTCKENLVLRSSIDPSIVSSIPNAVDTTKFVPDVSKRYPKDTINIVIISRLVYRKGIDLVVKTIPLVAKKLPHVYFIIGGDGNKRVLLEEMREKHRLHERVELLGNLPHSQVRDTLCRGHIFLNSSLTESFCIAILEAACCGLFVVSTKVGGVPEVLPPDMIKFSTYVTPESLAKAIEEAVDNVENIQPLEFNQRIANMYNWNDVAERTETVYQNVLKQPFPSLLDRFRKYYGVGFIAGLLSCFIVAMMYLYLQYLIWKRPDESIEEAITFPFEKYKMNQKEIHSESQKKIINNK